MNKKGNIYGLLLIILLMTLVSLFSVTFAVMQFGITNDYVLFNLQEVSAGLETSGLSNENITNQTLVIAQSYQSTISWGDDIWLLIYIIVFAFTVGVAYRIKDLQEINFFMILFFGTFILFFVGQLTDILVNWFLTNITLEILPSTLEFYPKFGWFMSNAGTVNLVHAMILLLASKFNFQFAFTKNINRQEMESLDEEEIN